MPIHLTEQDLVRHPHIRQLIGEETKIKKPGQTITNKRDIKYETQYRVLRSGVVGFVIGTVFMGIMMVV